MAAMESQLGADHLFRVDGMVAVITGGGTGIGLNMTRGLIANGAKRVYILGRRIEKLRKAAEESPNIIPIQCDVTSKDNLQAAVDQITREVGFVNFLAVNSGILGPPSIWKADASISELRDLLFTNLSMHDFTETLHVNVTAAWFTLTAFLELLDAGNKNALKGGFGKPYSPLEGTDAPGIQSQVLFTSSIASYSRELLASVSYSGSKAALTHLTKHSSSALARFGIRVNAIAPGLFPSDLASSLIGDRKPWEEPYGHPNFIPAQKFGNEGEMAGTILYLASRAGSFCNGLILVMDGGRLGMMRATY